MLQSAESDRLAPLRAKIDDVDEKIVGLLNERARIVQEIGQLKQGMNEAPYSSSREQAIYHRLAQLNPGPFPNEAIHNIFCEILSASLALEEPLRVAFLGPPTTFTHLAAVQRFGHSVTYVPADSIKGVFQEVEREQADFGVVPVENSIEGMVNYTLDLFMESPLKIFGEILQEISHCLLSNAESIEAIEQIYSHPHAVAQCRNFIVTYLPHVQIREASSTAQAAALAAKDKTAGAIASEAAARLYHLAILKKKIEDKQGNMTRFWVIAKRSSERGIANKTSVLVSIEDKIGALHEVLQVFSHHQVNLTKIESRPSKRSAWEYLFYMDMEGHVEDGSVQSAMLKLQAQQIDVKLLGSYPTAEAYNRHAYA